MSELAGKAEEGTDVEFFASVSRKAHPSCPPGTCKKDRRSQDPCPCQGLLCCLCIPQSCLLWQKLLTTGTPAGKVRWLCWQQGLLTLCSAGKKSPAAPRRAVPPWAVRASRELQPFHWDPHPQHQYVFKIISVLLEDREPVLPALSLPALSPRDLPGDD